MTKGLFAPEERKQRLESIYNTLIQAKNEYKILNYSKFILDIQFRWGLREEKAIEYLNLGIKRAEGIVVNDNITFEDKIELPEDIKKRIEGIK